MRSSWTASPVVRCCDPNHRVSWKGWPEMARPQFHARIGRLVERCAAAPGAEEWQVQFADGQCARAAAYPPLTGPLAVGEYVWLNTTAVELGLGTGGLHFVVAPAPHGDAARPAKIGAPAERAAGH